MTEQKKNLHEYLRCDDAEGDWHLVSISDRPESERCCYVCHQFLMRGRTPEEAVQNTAKAIENALSELRSRLTPEQMKREEWLQEKGLDPKLHRKIEELKALREQANDTEIEITLEILDERITRLREEIKELEKPTVIHKSAYEIIAKTMLNCKQWIESGWAEAETLDMQRLIAVSYFDDSRSYFDGMALSAATGRDEDEEEE